MELLKKIISIIRNRKIKKIRKKFNLDSSCRIYSSACITCIRGSEPSDIIIGKNVKLAGHLMSEYKGKIHLGDYAQIGYNSVIRCLENVYIGELTAISTGVVICDNNNHPINPLDREVLRKTPDFSYERSWIHSAHAPIVIERNCWIGENSRICKGVHIYEGSIVAANAVVTKDVPPFSIVAGNPAKVVKQNIDKTPRVFG